LGYFRQVSLIRSISLLFCALVIVFCNYGFHISQHWCGETLVNTSFFGEAEGCDHYKKKTVSCPFHAAKEQPKKCCEQQQVELESLDISAEIPMSFELTIPQLELKSFGRLQMGETERSSFVKTVKFFNHSPPLIGVRDRLSLLQVLLI